MEFTEIRQISSFSLPMSYYNHLRTKTSQEPKIVEIQDDQQNQSQVSEALKQLGQINNQFEIKSKQLQQSNQDVDKTKQLKTTSHKQTDEEEEQFKCNKKYDRTKSIIFNHSLSTRKSLTGSEIGYHVKIYYFGTPLMKFISYNEKSTIKQLIKRSLDAYLLQKKYDIQASQPVQRFQMRLPNSQNQFTPDLSVEPIHTERILSENMFQTLILIEKPKRESSSSQKIHGKTEKKNTIESKPTKEYSIEESSIEDSSFFHPQNKERVTLKLIDEKYNELIRIDLQKGGTLQKVFKEIRDRDLNEGREFVIKQDPDSEFDLNEEHQVRLIQKNRLYLMSKRYLDEAEDDLPAPIRLKTLVHQELNYLPPLGMTEASRYEEFQVTKVNSLGIAIDRILGIDQTKIYNYQKQLKKNQRQTNFIDKFLGFNPQTGTKIPSRLIKEIIKIQKFTGGIEVVFPQKTTTFLIKNEVDLQKIHRKLSFLLDYNKNHPKTASFSQLKIPKRIATFLNF